MMLVGPLLIALLPGIFCILLTVLFRRRQWKRSIRLIPGLLLSATAISMLWISLEIRGMEGAAYGFLSFFCFLFSLICIILALYKQQPPAE